MNTLIYNCCEGKVSDIKALEGSTYFEFCTILNSFLEKVKRQNEEIEKYRRENSLRSTTPTKQKSSLRKSK